MSSSSLSRLPPFTAMFYISFLSAAFPSIALVISLAHLPFSCCFLKIHLHNLVTADDFPHSQILGAHTLTEMVSKCRNKLCFKKIQDDNSRRIGNNDMPLSLKLHVMNLLGRYATLFYTVHNSEYYFRESATWRHAPS